MRTYVALGNETVAAAHAVTSESQEVWGYWPDDNPLKGLHPGDSRAALTPFLAHEVWDCHITGGRIKSDATLAMQGMSFSLIVF